MNAILLALALNPAHGNTMYDFTLKDIDGKETPLKMFEGKVALIVNVASRCGNTPQYEGLQKLYTKYKDQGFTVIGVPANEFKGQEPGTSAEIKAFCSDKYGVTFPMFEKLVVKGEGIHPLYQWLLETGPRKDDIEWNFAKFLVGKDGKVIARFVPKEDPNGEAIASAIEKALS